MPELGQRLWSIARARNVSSMSTNLYITASEAADLHAIAHGFALVHGENDHDKIHLETPGYDALYPWFHAELGRKV